MMSDTSEVKMDPVGSFADLEAVRLKSERLGPLPLLNHFIARLGLEELLGRFVPTHDRRCALPYGTALGVLLRSILVEREPIYRQHEVVSTFAPAAFGLTADQAQGLHDDQIGRALDRLFDADRGTLLTEILLAVQERFRLHVDELHNDSTSIRFAGQYEPASGRFLRGQRAPFITYGYSKDHRPDLKQLLFIVTTTTDGGVPLEFRHADGNTSDSKTHLETWQRLRAIAGRADFLYVADSKLCSGEAMEAIDRQHGRFVTVLPRSRKEDSLFRRWAQDHEPAFELARDRPNPRRRHAARDRWWVFRSPLGSQEGWPIVWVFSALLRVRQQRRRLERIAAATLEMQWLARRLSGPKPQVYRRARVQERVETILKHFRVRRYLRVRLKKHERHQFRQAGPGRPGPRTIFHRKTRYVWIPEWNTDEAAIAYDHRTDGMYPLLTNDRKLTPKEVLEAHKRQPALEKRFEQLKSVFAIAPVLLKNEGRIEAFFFLYFLALLLQALIERELRLAMQQHQLDDLPLYPEERPQRHPTCEQVLRLFSVAQRNLLHHDGRTLRVFPPEFTERQRQVLQLLGIQESAYQ